jgi:hypothetical protein
LALAVARKITSVEGARALIPNQNNRVEGIESADRRTVPEVSALPGWEGGSNAQDLLLTQTT